ncbi:LAFE_0F17722g1_1 [Lachancea fermentati]|uniref:LAFE_0F17722g1_1 n=1 Tax=Lachancea fermentati TaxID=4955 RepID=A0A1G4MGB2_LACFM|nr:LAFE_0F17722g1_1 [Lachancea fermentati]
MSEGASLEEQILDASRRNNADLLETIFQNLSGDEKRIANLINSAKDPMGNTALHLCCQYGSWEVLDKILDQEGGIEIDPKNIVDGDTPLHVTVRYAIGEPEHGTFIAQNLIEVGADPRIRNKSGQKPLDLIHGDNLDDLIDLLQGAELAADNGNMVNEEDAEIIDDGPED